MQHGKVHTILFSCLLAAFSTCDVLPPNACPAAETSWLTKAAFQQQLQCQSGITWSDTPLGQGLTNLARAQRVAIWLDRRIDPGQLMTITVDNSTLDVTLKRVSAALNVGVSYVDSVAYIGPRDVTLNLATLAAVKRDEAQELPAPARTRLLVEQAWSWKQLAVPRQLLTELARPANLRIDGLDLVPHDLWPAADLPPLTVADRFTLVLAGFRLSYQMAADGSSVRVVPMPDSAVITRSYTPRGDVQRALAQVTEAFPGTQLRRAGSRISATGRFEDLDLIRRLLRGERVTRSSIQGETRFDLAVENTPAGAIVKELARRMQLQVQVAPEVEARLRELVSFRVEQATADELLTATLKPAGIQFRLDGKVLQLLPAQR